MRIVNRIGRAVRRPAFGIAMITPIVLVGAVGAARASARSPSATRT